MRKIARMRLRTIVRLRIDCQSGDDGETPLHIKKFLYKTIGETTK